MSKSNTSVGLILRVGFSKIQRFENRLPNHVGYMKTNYVNITLFNHIFNKYFHTNNSCFLNFSYSYSIAAFFIEGKRGRLREKSSQCSMTSESKPLLQRIILQH